MVPVCSSGTLTNVLPHRNAMPQTQGMTSHPVTVYRHGADLSLCYPLMWNATLEYTATHFNVMSKTRPGNPSSTFHTHTPANAQLNDAVKSYGDIQSAASSIFRILLLVVLIYTSSPLASVRLMAEFTIIAQYV